MRTELYNHVSPQHKSKDKPQGERDSLYSLQQHLEPSTFMPPRDITHGASLPSASTPLRGQPRLQPTMLAPVEEPKPRTPPRPVQIAPCTTELHITSFGRALPPREVASEVILTPDFIAILDDLLDRRERRATSRTVYPTESYRTKEAIS